MRAHSFGHEPSLICILQLLFQVAMYKGLLVLKHPSNTALCAFELAPGHEVIRAWHRFHRHQSKYVLIGKVKRQGTSINGHGALQRSGDCMKKGVPGSV